MTLLLPSGLVKVFDTREEMLTYIARYGRLIADTAACHKVTTH